MEDKKEVVKEFLTETVLKVISEYGIEAGKEQLKDVAISGGTEIAAMVGLDMLGSIIPGIGGAISSYRVQKQIRNLNVLIIELQKRIEEIQSNLKYQTEENKDKLDLILEMIVYKASNSNQSEKIEYMINGFTELTGTEDISYDIGYLYYDLLDRMTILDISVLKFMQHPIYQQTEDIKTYLDIMEEFNINYDQYNSVRNNLNRMGLLENKYDETLGKDLDSLVSDVNDLNKAVISIQSFLEKPKKNNKIMGIKKNTKSKLKAKDKLKVSKFGREFAEFFIVNNTVL